MLQQIRIVRKVPLALGGVVTLLQGGLFVRQGARRSRARDSSSHTRLASAADRALALANTLRAVSSGSTAGRASSAVPQWDKARACQGIGLRQRDAFPKGAFKAFPELGGGAAGKGNGKDALSGDARP